MKRAIVFAVRLSWFSHLVSQEMIIQSIICSSVNPVSMNTDNLTVAAPLTGKKTVIQSTMKGVAVRSQQQKLAELAHFRKRKEFCRKININ